MFFRFVVLDQINRAKTSFTQFFYDLEILIWITSLDLVAYLSHSLVQGRLVKHSLEAGGNTEVDRHEELERWLLDFFVVDLHLSDESFPFLGQPDEPKLWLRRELDLVSFLCLGNLNDILQLLWIKLLDLVKEVVLPNVISADIWVFTLFLFLASWSLFFFLLQEWLCLMRVLLHFYILKFVITINLSRIQ